MELRHFVGHFCYVVNQKETIEATHIGAGIL